MLPTLQSNDRVLLTSYFYQPKQGDVVVITHTAKLQEPIMKRVIALVENQTVDIDFETGTVYVDGQALDESAYIENGITTQPSDYTYPLTVPPGHLFVLGDNRACVQAIAAAVRRGRSMSGMCWARRNSWYFPLAVLEKFYRNTTGGIV